MLTHARNLVGGLVLGSAVLLSPVAPAAASVDAQQAGLVNVDVGGVRAVNGNQVGIGVAAQVAAEICNLSVGQVGILAQQVARQGTAQACTIQQGNQQVPVTLTRNPR